MSVCKQTASGVATLTDCRPPWTSENPMPIHPSLGPYILKVMLLPFTSQNTVQLVPMKVWTPLHVAVSRGSTSNIHTYEKQHYLMVSASCPLFVICWPFSELLHTTCDIMGPTRTFFSMDKHAGCTPPPDTVWPSWSLAGGGLECGPHYWSPLASRSLMNWHNHSGVCVSIVQLALHSVMWVKASGISNSHAHSSLKWSTCKSTYSNTFFTWLSAEHRWQSGLNPWNDCIKPVVQYSASNWNSHLKISMLTDPACAVKSSVRVSTLAGSIDAYSIIVAESTTTSGECYSKGESNLGKMKWWVRTGNPLPWS